MTTPTNPIDETLAHPGATLLDECLRRDPANIPDADLDAIIAYSREERTRFALKTQYKEDKKDGFDGTETMDAQDRADE